MSSKSSLGTWGSLINLSKYFGTLVSIFLADISRDSSLLLNFFYLAYSDINWDGIAFGNITNQAGRSSSSPGIIINTENGINLKTSALTCCIFRLAYIVLF